MFWNLVFTLALGVNYACAAMTDEEVKIRFTKFVMTCHKDHPVEMNELLALQSLQLPKTKESKCLLACAYKTEGSMNDKGMYDLEHAYKLAEETQKGDDKRLEKAKKLADTCAKVNDETVTDGEKGCDRAALIFKCVVQNAPKTYSIHPLWPGHTGCVHACSRCDEAVTVLLDVHGTIKLYDFVHNYLASKSEGIQGKFMQFCITRKK